MRIQRLLAVSRYETRTHMTGRQALRLLAVSAVLLLPAAAVHTPRLAMPEFGRSSELPLPVEEFEWGAGPPPPPKVLVRGTIPAELQSRLVLSDYSPFEIRGENPVVVVAEDISPAMRAALETIDGPVQLEVKRFENPLALPGRSLLIAILAVSLLTGPLADSLPGERARRTLEVLLTAGISRGELIGGKWLAWTISASTTAGIAAAVACWRGVQEPGWWLLGLPLFIASAIAFGLWLVRLVDDVVGGSAAPMRILPVAATATAALAVVVAQVSPVAAAAVPLGGPLLVAADVYRSLPQVIASVLGTIVFVTAMLMRTGSELDRVDTTSSPTRWGAVGLCAVAILLWWLTVGGTGIWGSAGNTDLVRDLPHSMMVGGLALLSCAVVAMAREFRTGPVLPQRTSPPLTSVLVTLAVAAALAASGPIPAVDAASAGAVTSMLERLREGALPAGMTTSAWIAAGGIASIFGQAILFRGVVATRAGWMAASLLWCLAVCPWTPWSVLSASFALGALAAGHGFFAALVAQLIWALASSHGPGAASVPLALALQVVALAIAFGSLRLPRALPMRHQL
ncbi:MAG: hypothetical protein ABR538_04390 [Candidatus Binatia bacterium]